FTVSSQVDDAEIDAERSTSFLWFRSRNFQCDSQIEGSIPIKEISLPFDCIYTGLLIAPHDKGNKHTARKGQKRHMGYSFKAHDTLIIDDSAFRPKCRLDALITLVGFTRF